MTDRREVKIVCRDAMSNQSVLLVGRWSDGKAEMLYDYEFNVESALSFHPHLTRFDIISRIPSFYRRGIDVATPNMLARLLLPKHIHDNLSPTEQEELTLP